ncbi:MipA/OmpV family protein [Aliiglaciecola sp. SL4]|uniref:MipA/OmpV family protein n=1 Tax=Aliiglaciecola sp. SL4 TaxID=3239806 RepID=UPI00355C61B4
MFKHYLIYVIFFITVGFASPTLGCDTSKNCIQEGEWDVGLALGVGLRTNPLVDGDNFPNLILIDIAWYGERFYFDNGEVGYQWQQSSNFGVESYLTLDREKTFFELWHPGNLTVPAVIPSSPAVDAPDKGSDDNPPAEDLRLSVNEISDRNWAINFGTRLHYYHGNHEISFSIETDASNVHHGEKANLSYQYFWAGDDWQFILRPSLIWKSAKLANYYYGINEKDSIEPNFHYSVSSGIQPGISFLYTKKINEQWHWVSNLAFRKLHSSMVKSPIVEENNVTNVFLGVGRRF